MHHADKQDPTLSLRLALNTPNAEIATVAAKVLNDTGLKVQHVSPRGLLISAPQSLIERFFETRIDFKDKMPQFGSEPHFGRLPGNVAYRAYFPSEPILF